MDSSPPNVSFIGIVDFSQEARWIYVSHSVTDLLGFEPTDLLGKPSMELVHPDEFARIRKLHFDTIHADKAAALVYLRLRHKDPYKGYILCASSRTIVHNVVVGSVSFASPGAKAMQNASTAQEIVVVAPTAANFEFRRWNDPSPLPPSPRPMAAALPGSPALSSSSWGSSNSRNSRSPARGSGDHNHSGNPNDGTELMTYDHLPNQSFRTAFILERFSRASPILYCSNDWFLSTTACMGRSFLDFVSKKDEEIVRSWIECVKGWGVNERGHPSDGGFGFGRFLLLPEGRDSSSERTPEPATPSRSRHGQAGPAASSRARTSRSNASGVPRTLPASSDSTGPKILVDAIFSAHSDGFMVIVRRATT